MGQLVKNLPAIQNPQETWVWFLGWEDPLEEGMAIHSSTLDWILENPMDREAWRLQSTGPPRVRQD